MSVVSILLPPPLLDIGNCVFSVISLMSLARNLLVLLISSRNPLIFLYCIFLFVVCSLLPFFCFGFVFFSKFLKVEVEVIDCKSVHLPNNSLQCYKFSSKHCFSYTSHIFICHVFIFIYIKIFSNFPCEFFCDTWVVFRRLT